MSYEYFLKIEDSKNPTMARHQFFEFFRDKPYAFFKGNSEIIFSESSGTNQYLAQQCDARLIRADENFTIQVNRRCDNLYKLFKRALEGKKYSINEEDDDEIISLEKIFRQK